MCTRTGLSSLIIYWLPFSLSQQEECDTRAGWQWGEGQQENMWGKESGSQISSREGTVPGCARRPDFCFSPPKHLNGVKNNKAVLPPACLTSSPKVVFSFLSKQNIESGFTLRCSIAQGRAGDWCFSLSRLPRGLLSSYTSPPQHRPFTGIRLGDD